LARGFDGQGKGDARVNAKHVELIAIVAETGSLGAAAVILNRSQPAISKALQAAERDIGCQIFQRSPAGVVPTVEGRRVVDRCRMIRRDLGLLSEDVAQLRGDVSGTLNIVVSPLSAVQIVPQVLDRYRRSFPHVQVQVTSGQYTQAFRKLRDRSTDYVLGPAPEGADAAGLRSKPIARTGITFLTGKTSRYLDETDPQVLHSAPWLMIGPRGRTPLYHQYFERHGLSTPLPKICSDSILTILTMIEGSDYLCSFPKELLPNLEARWELAQAAVPSEHPDVVLALTAEVGRVPTIAALAFEDIVHAVVGETSDQNA
jgi:DNA-binding transcriptional LysR family regulator